MIILRSYLASFVGLLFFSLFAANANADAKASDLHDSDIEHIHVIGQRNWLKSNALVENNAHFSEFIQNQAIKPTIAHWLVQTPGLSLNGQGGLLQSYSVRGFSKSRVHTAVDGVPIYTDRRAGNSASFLPATLVHGVDVQKGPSSTLYGSDALGGVINLQSLAFENKFIAASAQSNDQHKELTYAYGNDDWQSAVNYRHANNAKSADGTVLNTGFEQFAMVQKLKTQLDDIDIKLTWIPSVGKDIGKSSITYPDERLTQYPDEQHSLFVAEFTQEHNWYGKLYHHYQNWDSDIIRVEKRRNLTEYQSHTIGGSFLTSTPLLHGQARFGVDWINRQGVSIKETEFNLDNQVQFSKQLLDGQQHNSALFSDVHWQLDDVGIAMGIRYDHISQRQFIDAQNKSDQSLNGSLLVNWAVNNTFNLQAEIATGFRFPTLTELYFEGETPRGTTEGNPYLDPEHSRGLQLAVSYQASSIVSIEFSSYYYQMDDYIERYSIDEDTRGYRNLTQADIYGFESTVAWISSNQWVHQLSYQWQQGEDEEGSSLSDLQVPTWKLASQWNKYDFTFSNQLNYRVSRQSHSTQEQALGSFLDWRMTLTYQLIDDTSISVWGENLLNRTAFTTADEDAPLVQGISLGVKLVHQFL
ncbi:TonB-dependent receptor plug domain-containing protein [Thalassotalea atypica]|uniref:TonB-dependent receptor plug domain-containing protein n=1 Tax=Thalassotalea atypica TaxID=2054316 RepID=UPI002573F35E|nr:TonB-dependent receptor [Thalassotalea atypica]